MPYSKSGMTKRKMTADWNILTNHGDIEILIIKIIINNNKAIKQ